MTDQRLIDAGITAEQFEDLLSKAIATLHTPTFLELEDMFRAEEAK